MNNPIRSSLVLASVASLACALAVAQSSGEAIYKQRCLNCHGPNGMAGSGIGRVLRVRPITDPDIRILSEAAMITLTRNGVGKMQAYKGDLTDAQIKDSVDYLRTFLKK